MKQVDKISVAELKEMAERMYGFIVKADVDTKKNIIVIDMVMHADGEAYMMEHGSKQNDLWGINLKPDNFGTNEFIEFDSMINIRPSQGNYFRSIEDSAIRQKITEIVAGTVHE